MSLVPYERNGRPALCSCGVVLELMVAPALDHAAILVCRNPEHGPYPWVWTGSTFGPPIPETRITTRILAAEVITRERVLSEIVRTGQSSHPTAREHHGAGNAGRLPEGAVAGVKIAPEDRLDLAAELRRIAYALETSDEVLDRARRARILARVQRAFGDADREATDIAGRWRGRAWLDATIAEADPDAHRTRARGYLDETKVEPDA